MHTVVQAYFVGLEYLLRESFDLRQASLTLSRRREGKKRCEFQSCLKNVHHLRQIAKQNPRPWPFGLEVSEEYT